MMLAAATIGAVAALAAKPEAAAPAAAATHCTRYAASVSQDYNCYLYMTLANSTTYSTPATALRDGNFISLSAERNWTLWYVGGNGAASTKTLSSGSIGSSGGYATAACRVNNGSVDGVCYTNWHD
jgi:hypothetical protein